MNSTISKLDTEGYVVVDDVASHTACVALTDSLPKIRGSGSRSLLSHKPYRDFVDCLRWHPEISPTISELVAVQCTLFHKTLKYNWAVRLRRDSVFPINGDGSWPSAGIKEGMSYARPPFSFLNSCVGVRLNLDEAAEGDLLVVPKSHKQTNIPDSECKIPIAVPRGGALLIRPTLLHGSSKLSHCESRRVLHFVFAPASLPEKYSWHHAA